jgi:hypothetical protein
MAEDLVQPIINRGAKAILLAPTLSTGMEYCFLRTVEFRLNKIAAIWGCIGEVLRSRSALKIHTTCTSVCLLTSIFRFRRYFEECHDSNRRSSRFGTKAIISEPATHKASFLYVRKACSFELSIQGPICTCIIVILRPVLRAELQRISRVAHFQSGSRSRGGVFFLYCTKDGSVEQHCAGDVEHIFFSKMMFQVVVASFFERFHMLLGSGHSRVAIGG